VKGKAEGEEDKHRDKYLFQLQLRIFRLAISIIPQFPVKWIFKFKNYRDTKVQRDVIHM
jgi:hypothetical protein